MSTRAVIARTVPGGWRGVVHIYDSAPWDLGNVVLIEIVARQGDLDGVVRELVDEGEGGWESFVNRDRADDEPEPFYVPDDLGEDVGWIDWFYLFDVDGRRLDVFRGEAPDAQGQSTALEYTLRFDRHGRSEPALFEAPEEPWSDIGEDEGWSADHEHEASKREVVVESIEAWCESAGRSSAQVRQAVAARLAAAIRSAEWTPPPPRESVMESLRKQQLAGRSLDTSQLMQEADELEAAREERSLELLDRGLSDRPLRQTPVWGEGARYWRVRLDGITVLYASGNALRQSFDPLTLAREDGFTTTIGDFESLVSDDEELALQLKIACLTAENPGIEMWYSEDDGVYTVVTVVESDPGPNEVALTSSSLKGGDFEVGEELIRPIHGDVVIHWMLDWIRAGQVQP